MRAIAYPRVSTFEQAESGGGLAAQREAISREISARGWRLAEECQDGGISGGIPWQERAGLSTAIRAIEGGRADCLVVARLDRLSRSVGDFASLIERARRKRWAVVALDLGVDTSTPSGELLSTVLAAFSQFERRLIGERTREGMAALRARGKHMGPASRLDPRTRERIVSAHASGQPLRAIARDLNRDGIATGKGGRAWDHSACEPC